MSGQREVRAAAAGMAIVGLYMALILASGRVDAAMFGKLLLFYIGLSAKIWLMLGGVTLFIAMVVEHRTGGTRSMVTLILTFAQGRWARDRGTSLFWPPLLFATLLSCFNTFKQKILPLAGYGWDPILADIDRTLFFGNDPWRVTHALFGAPSMTVFIDHAYHGWFIPMSLGLIGCAWLPRATFRLRTQYMLSYIGVWIGIGSVMAFLTPSSGPCFFNLLSGPNDSFADLLAHLESAEVATGATLTSLSNQAMLAEARHLDQIAVGGGISAMPSVHNALAILFTLAAFRFHRTVGWIVAAYAVAIWIGSIHLGWHYAVDGLAALCLTLATWTVCGRIAAALDHQPATDLQATALA